MEQQIGWLPASLPPDVCCSRMTSGYQWLPAKQYVDRSRPTYVQQSTAEHRRSDIGCSTDSHRAANAEPPVQTCDRISTAGGQLSTLNESQPGTNCCLSSPPVEELTDSFHIDADSTEVTVVTEVTMDHPGDLPVIKSELQPTHSQSDSSADIFESRMQPPGDSSLCSVCGDVAAGFHCGAYVCEACKVRM